MCKSSWSIAGPEAVYYTFKVFWDCLKAASWLHMLRMQATFPKKAGQMLNLQLSTWRNSSVTSFMMYLHCAIKLSCFFLFFFCQSSDITGVQSFQVFAKAFSIIASIISTVVKASVNLIGISYWFINSHHYCLQWLFCILLKKKITIKMHKADKGSCSFLMIPFILLKEWRLRSFSLLSSYILYGQARDRTSPPFPLLFRHWKLWSAIKFHQLGQLEDKRQRRNAATDLFLLQRADVSERIHRVYQSAPAALHAKADLQMLKKEMKRLPLLRWMGYAVQDVHSICFSYPLDPKTS